MPSMAYHVGLLTWLVLPAWACGQDTANEASETRRLYRIDTQRPEGLQQLLGYDADVLPLVSAHRGGPQAGLPENCLETFEHTLQNTYAMLEIDPRMTKDGEVVIHHDATLDRTTTGNGPIKDRTLRELKQLRLRDIDGKPTGFTIPTLDETLEWARGKAILVLDQKDVPVAARVKKIREHRAEAYAMLIVYGFKDVQLCYELNPKIMMEVMIPNRRKAEEFDSLGIPWRNIIAFVGHDPPMDDKLYEFIHAKGARCMIGTSRNLDRQWLEKKVLDVRSLEPDYRALLSRGADIIETDIPAQLAPMLYQSAPVPDSKRRFFSSN